jgi:nucleoside-diphosphate-sugar epimerase
MRIVITGGAGFLGTHAVALAVAAGHRVVAVDITPAEIPGAESIHADLLDCDAVRTVLAGADAVVHLGNHCNVHRAEAHALLAENTVMNANVFYAAAGHGVRHVVFASSIQAVSGGPTPPGLRYLPAPERRLPALPLDGDTPANAGNAYGLGKVFGEQLLAQLAGHHPLHAIAVRLPWLVSPEQSKNLSWENPAHIHRQAEIYTWLRVEDAARLLLACVSAPLPGFRVYQPAMPLPADWPDAETLARQYLPDAPRRRPGVPLTRLVDISRITRETGWTPSPRA